MCDRCGCQQPDSHARVDRSVPEPPGDSREIHVESRILAENDRLAQHNRAHFLEHRLFAVNLMGAPGAGKTALLEATIRAMNGRWRIAAIEGDQASQRDRDRIAATGAAVEQIETGLGCHLDARQVHHALDHLPLAKVDALFIENVGNLVCPALFDLGEHLRVVVTSPTEGTDKPLKYPPMFRAADLIVLNKIDLLPHVPFDLREWHGYVTAINPRASVLMTAATTREGIDEWIVALMRRRVAAAGAWQ